MAKTKISEFSSTPANNTDIDSINIAEGCAPSGINDAIRELMAQLKDFQTGAVGDSFNGPVGTTTPAAGAFTTLSATGNVTLGDASTDTLNVGNGGLIKDASGNLGLGVTPSAWRSVDRVMQAGSGTSEYGHFVSGGNGAAYGSGFYRDSGGFKYTLSATPAGRFDYNYAAGGGFTWNLSPSGTAGNAITFTQAMTLTADGNLGLGTTSPTSRLEVRYNSAAPISWGGTGSFNNNYGSLTWGTDLAIVQANAGYSLVFNTNGNNERARIDSSGNLLVGTTSNPVSDRLVVDKSISINSAGGAEPQINFNSSNASIEFVNRNSGGSKTFKWYYQASAAGSPATLSTSGVWTNASDIRGKENIIDIGYGLETVIALKPRKFDVKSDGSHAIGFIAQELLNTIPEVVHVTMTDKDGSNWYGVDYGAITSVLVKAIQEQQAIISAQSAVLESLKARLDAANL